MAELPKDGGYTVTLAEVKPERVNWLWPGRVPRGMLTLLVGDPGLGKSLLTIDLAAKVSRAEADVLLLSAEDHAGATIRPRAEAAGAYLERIHLVGVRREGFDDGIALPNDADALGRLASEHKARLIIVDPLSAHLPESVNSWHDQSVRRALAPLHRLAEDHQAAVVVVAHLNKAKGADPLYRTGGSIAIPAAVRSALLLARDPEDPDGERGRQRVLAHHKCNVADLAESLVCRIEPVNFRADETAQTACLKIIGTSEIVASDLLDAPKGAERTKRDDAADFLRQKLAGGPRPTKALQKAAEDAGIGWRTIEDAKGDLGIQAEKQGFGGGWSWSLPQDRAPHTANPAAFAEQASPSGHPGRSTTVDRKAAEAESGSSGLNLTASSDDPPCRYSRHRASDYIGQSGRKICGICHPQAGGAP